MRSHPPPGSLGMSTTEPAPDATQPGVEVFWRPGCPFCTALRIDLTRRGIPAQWRNIWQDEDARGIVRELNNGNETVPTVRVGSQHLTNPSGSEVAEAVLGRPGSVARRRPAGAGSAGTARRRRRWPRRTPLPARPARPPAKVTAGRMPCAATSLHGCACSRWTCSVGATVLAVTHTTSTMPADIRLAKPVGEPSRSRSLCPGGV